MSLPDRYGETGDRYPVIYMLDGEINFSSGVIGGLRQAAFLGEMPEFIVVGVANIDRSKDIFRTATEQDLKDAFAAFGEVSSSSIIKDNFSGESRGFGFVEMPNKEEADKAVSGLNGKDLKGRPPDGQRSPAGHRPAAPMGG